VSGSIKARIERRDGRFESLLEIGRRGSPAGASGMSVPTNSRIIAI
jgi:hypothetical protein